VKKIKLYIAVSIDGYIAMPDGNVDWLSDPAQTKKNPGDYGYEEFYDSIDTTLMGYNTYLEIKGFGIPFPYPDKKNYVFSRHHKKLEKDPVRFIRSDIIPFVKGLKKEKGKDIWLVGGGQINGILLQAGLIDEMIITTIPVILGNGIPLFSSVSLMKRFAVLEVKNFHDLFVQIRFVKR